MKKLATLFVFFVIHSASLLSQSSGKSDYVNPLMGTDSKYLYSNGNTYPAIAMPWGMNFWMPQTGNMATKTRNI